MSQSSSPISSASIKQCQPIHTSWSARRIASKIEAIASVVAGILFLVSGVLLLTLAIPAVPVSVALSLGIIAVAVGSALTTLGICQLMPQLRISRSRQMIDNLMETLISRERALAALIVEKQELICENELLQKQREKFSEELTNMTIRNNKLYGRCRQCDRSLLKKIFCRKK